MIKAIIFDLNGVFLESQLLSTRFCQKFPNVSEEEFVQALKDVMSQVRKPGVSNAFKLWQPYFQKWGLSLSSNDFWQFWFSGEHLVPKLLEYAQTFRQKGIKVFILSNNFKERTQYYREHFPEIFSSVDGSYFSWETGFVKPEPSTFTNLLERNNLKPEETIFFDDQDKNIETATSLGIVAI